MMKTAGTGKVQKENGEKKEIILVVDGRPLRQFYTSIFLQRLKYHVIMAKTAEDGLIFLDMVLPVVIIVNIDLQLMSGVDFLKRIKQDDRTKKIPVIIYTSNKDSQIQHSCEQAGCAAYLRHPASLEELYVAVQKATHKPRRLVRLETFLDVVVADGSIISGSTDSKDYIAVISELGMFVCTDKTLAYGSIHPFTFHLPNAPGWVIKAEGEIVYHDAGGDAKKPGIGVKFLKIGAQEREFIKDFIRGKLMEGIEKA